MKHSQAAERDSLYGVRLSERHLQQVKRGGWGLHMAGWGHGHQFNSVREGGIVEEATVRELGTTSLL